MWGWGGGIANKSFADVEKTKYWGMKVAQQNDNQKVKIKLHSGSACYLSVHSSLSYLLLKFSSKSVKLEIYFLFCRGWQLDLALGGKHTDRT